MKFAIDCGHNAFPDTGASGWIQEDDGTKQIGQLVAAGLQSAGHTAIIVTPFGKTFQSVVGSLGYRCKVANENNVDVYVSIHMNASDGRGHGAEVYAISDSAKRLARNVQSDLVSIGFTDRGVKEENLYVLRNTTAPSILVEVCFCDSAIDQDLYNPNKIAQSIIAGLIGRTIALAPPTPVQKAVGVNMDTISIQHALNKLGVTDDNGRKLVEDGISGTRTTQAIKKFQYICGISADGIAGMQTKNCIDQIMAKPLCSAGSSPNVPARYIQYRVGLVPDGIFGAGTAKAVKTYQVVHGLVADGIVGRNTWSVFIS